MSQHFRQFQDAETKKEIDVLDRSTGQRHQSRELSDKTTELMAMQYVACNLGYSCRNSVLSSR